MQEKIASREEGLESHRMRLGRRGENFVQHWLEDHGVCVLARNWRGKNGEIDLVAHDGSRLRIVEVKTRSSLDYGHPLEAITEEKYRRLWRLGCEFRDSRPELSGSLVIDVAALLYSQGRWNIEYLADVRP